MSAVATLRRSRRGGQPASRRLRPWYENRSLVAGLIIVGIMVLLAVLAPLISPDNPLHQNLDQALQGPSGSHWLGTDKLGRDVLSRLLYGARVDLKIGFLAVLIPFVVGSVLGAIAGYYGGWVDIIIMRVVDVFYAFPLYLLVIALVFVMGSGERSIYLAIALVSWVSYCKIVRGEVIVARRQEYVQAARLGGLKNLRVLARHVGPNVVSQAITYAMSDIIMDIMVIVTLGYLGLGITPPTAEWGSMISDAQEFITTLWWMAVLPGVAVVITGLGLSLIGDGLGDLLSPERRR
ncbi:MULTISPECIES: ABC transporter permease [unclassified Allobranchiibius]|uniref:ABC transporter permease n=1 Tax=unclassified Allobranchiibius TaxID=2649857 RepID=UPI001AA0E182|nr:MULTISPECIES: ABC transporter permease [unclassified Allobranchiibius]MBO1766643.1 ABC transporter permease [Allobranchiibius sp. GilTou38]UIJ33767.1 ABC transporter permease [Allobranchiibius sp. GilTou73]